MKQTVKQRGFTLAEIAIVLAVIGIAMTMGLKMLIATLENTAISETQAKQERIKLALVSFLRSNGRLPCPDTATPATGNEVTPCIASVALGYGIPPWQTLQLSRDAVLDGWGNFFSYRVANTQPVAVLRNWTSRTPIGTAFDINELTNPNAALIIQERAAPAAALTQITDRAVFVILSHGKNGLGALTTRGAARVPPPTVAVALDENTNGTVGARTFVRRAFNERPQDAVPPVPPPVNPGGPFDDLVAYMTGQELLRSLTTEKTLFGCEHYCATGAPTCAATNIPVGAATATCP
jgi:prepilin-type N-terminal cleavage/methylation domain-containing protein